MSEDDTDSEEEVPWWTFTNLGMAKMRARMAGERSRASGPVSGQEGHGRGKRATTIAEAAAELQAAEAEAQAHADADASAKGHVNGEASGTPARPEARARVGGPSGSGGMSGGESDGKDRHAYSYSQYKHRMRDRFHRKASRDDSSPTPPSRPDRDQAISASPLGSSSAPVPLLGPPITDSGRVTTSKTAIAAPDRTSHPSTQNLSDLEAHCPPVSPDAARKRSKPSPIRSLSHFTSDHIFRRGSDRSDSHSHNTSDADRDQAPKRKPRFAPRRAFTRSNSAPGSPMDVEELVESPQTGATPLEMP